MAEKTTVNIPDEAVNAGWWTSSGQDMREQDIREVVAAAAPLIMAAELEKILAGCWDYPYEQWTTMVADRATKRLAELRAGS